MLKPKRLTQGCLYLSSLKNLDIENTFVNNQSRARW